MAKKKLTAEDLDKTLAECGFKEGDEIELPSEETQSNENTEEGGEGDGDEGEGGGNHPKKGGGN